MKKLLHNLFKIRFAASLGLIFFLSRPVKGGEFVLMNGQITFGAGDNAYTNLIKNFSGYPSNWLSPDDYFHGVIYTYYEVVNVATNAPFYMQFGIFQYYPNAAGWDGHSYAEVCENIQPLQGVGAHVFNSSTPVGWWSTSAPLTIDFARVSDFQSIGTVLVGSNPGGSPSAAALSPTSEGGNDAIWAMRANWLPCTIKVVAVAVSSGSTFSGWANYLGGGSLTQQPTPTYGVDFGYETTDAPVSSADEYSSNADMSGAISGAGQKLNLTPGHDVYFRTKAGGGLTASEIQHLVVPNRPVTPSIEIDYANVETMQAVSSTTAYSTSSSYTNPISGTNAKIALMPGQDVYFWTKATSSSFGSLYYHLVVPNRPPTPDFQIDFSLAKTVQAVSSTDEYSIQADMSGAISGTDAIIDLTPGTDLYFRVKSTASSFASDIQHLVVGSRPEAPVLHIDFNHETTAEVINNTVEYAASADFSNSATGTGVVLNVTPGQSRYFRIKSTESSFRSANFFLEVPVRPVLEYTGEAIVNTPLITMQALLDESMTGFKLTDLSITNGHAQNLQASNIFDIIPDAEGDVVVKIPFNVFGGASFASNEVTVNYTLPTGIAQLGKEQYNIFPNPSITGIINIKTNNTLPYSIGIYSINGNLIRTVEMNSGLSQQLNLKDLSKGTYFLRIISNGNNTIHKLVLE